MNDNRVTPERVESLLAGCTAHYNKLHGTTTVCQLVMQNGFTLAIGVSACVDPKNFDALLGRKYAYEDAVKKGKDQLWLLEGYRLAMQLNPV